MHDDVDTSRQLVGLRTRRRLRAALLKPQATCSPPGNDVSVPFMTRCDARCMHSACERCKYIIVPAHMAGCRAGVGRERHRVNVDAGSRARAHDLGC